MSNLVLILVFEKILLEISNLLLFASFSLMFSEVFTLLCRQLRVFCYKTEKPLLSTIKFCLNIRRDRQPRAPFAQMNNCFSKI